MNPDVATHLDHECGRLLVGLEAKNGIRASLLIPVDASREDVVHVTGRLRNEVTNELAYLEQVGVAEEANADAESNDGTKYGRQGVGEDVLVTDGGVASTAYPADVPLRIRGRAVLTVESVVPAGKLQDEEHAANVLKGGFYDTRTVGIEVHVDAVEPVEEDSS